MCQIQDHLVANAQDHLVAKDGSAYKRYVNNKRHGRVRILSRHYEKTNEAIFCKFFDPFFLAKIRFSQNTDITNGSGVKKYARWCIRIAKSSTDDPILALFHFFGIFLIRLFVVPGQ